MIGTYIYNRHTSHLKSPFGGFRGLLFLLLIFFSSCDIDRQTEVCEYNARIIYRYNRENTTFENVLPMYIQSLDEYIFDEHDVLYAINRLPGISCFGKYVSEINLPPGKYTVITWGNKAEPSKVNKEQVGVTTKQEMMLYLDNPYVGTKSTDAMQSDSERLYYGYRTFTIEKYGVSKINVDMTHAHCVLDITVRWAKMAEAPTATAGYYMQLKEIACDYSFMPGFVFQGGDANLHSPAYDTYPAGSSESICYMSRIYSADNLISHYTLGDMNTETRSLQSRFITYRYSDSSHQLLSIYLGGTRIMKEIDLAVFFNAMSIVLDTNRRQEFDLLLIIDGDNVTVSLVKIDDWDEGGYL
ncbi:fimbrillin-A associated anchor protein Mfa1/Mfa2 [Dysgonomonas alginatilytica]|uniref:Fimbrillin-A associated anchor protein Mfa1/Mfa2 n=1 Tax=Dysgonomonas alginatilytica TaxID=1605892 RepID=A0A2V3PLT2_9BACT|nr:FimB/Mfa2 family fimbrial subunit [Dysgonomonas alginatilytica]PXV60100.1 fimbrillin-A associated anchor protein Mfa1/Mfa2 [Dysgonomonas alginatilytica]